MLNEALRLVRVFHDINQTHLAEQLGISKSYLSQIESGNKKVSIDLIGKYSEIFNVPPSSLMLFSEKLESKDYSEKARVFMAGKLVKMMSWIAEKEEGSNAI